MPLLGLPRELLDLIVSFVDDIETLASCQQTCLVLREASSAAFKHQLDGRILPGLEMSLGNQLFWVPGQPPPCVYRHPSQDLAFIHALTRIPWSSECIVVFVLAKCDLSEWDQKTRQRFRRLRFPHLSTAIVINVRFYNMEDLEAWLGVQSTTLRSLMISDVEVRESLVYAQEWPSLIEFLGAQMHLTQLVISVPANHLRELCSYWTLARDLCSRHDKVPSSRRDGDGSAEDDSEISRAYYAYLDLIFRGNGELSTKVALAALSASLKRGLTRLHRTEFLFRPWTPEETRALWTKIQAKRVGLVRASIHPDQRHHVSWESNYQFEQLKKRMKRRPLRLLPLRL